MSYLAESDSNRAWRASSKRLIPYWAVAFLSRFGLAEHPCAEEWERAGHRLRERFLEDWTAHSTALSDAETRR